MEIIPFLFNDINNIRTLKDEHGNIWFVAKDIADVLQYSETEKMTRRIDREDISKIKSADLAGLTKYGNNDISIINESGLYSATNSKSTTSRNWKLNSKNYRIKKRCSRNFKFNRNPRIKKADNSLPT